MLTTCVSERNPSGISSERLICQCCGLYRLYGDSLHCFGLSARVWLCNHLSAGRITKLSLMADPVVIVAVGSSPTQQQQQQQQSSSGGRVGEVGSGCRFRRRRSVKPGKEWQLARTCGIASRRDHWMEHSILKSAIAKLSSSLSSPPPTASPSVPTGRIMRNVVVASASQSPFISIMSVAMIWIISKFIFIIGTEET